MAMRCGWRVAGGCGIKKAGSKSKQVQIKKRSAKSGRKMPLQPSAGLGIAGYTRATLIFCVNVDRSLLVSPPPLPQWPVATHGFCMIIISHLVWWFRAFGV